MTGKERKPSFRLFCIIWVILRFRQIPLVLKALSGCLNLGAPPGLASIFKRVNPHLLMYFLLSEIYIFWYSLLMITYQYRLRIQHLKDHLKSQLSHWPWLGRGNTDLIVHMLLTIIQHPVISFQKWCKGKYTTCVTVQTR